MRVAVEIDNISFGFDKAEKQLPFALALAINDSAKDALEAIRGRITAAFDRPTPYTKNAFAVTQRASKETLTAIVQMRDNRGNRHYLRTQEDGGPRRMTRLESMLSRTVATPGIIRAVIPGDNAKLDQYGNWSGGDRNKAISGIKGWAQVGYNANRTSRTRNKATANYFVPQHGLPPGIYRRRGRDLDIIAIFTDKAPTYQPRFQAEDAAEEAVFKRFGDHFAKRFDQAMATAR